MTLTKTYASKLAVAFVAFALLFSLVATPVANAQTNEELQAQITALLAQIAGLQGQLGGGAVAGASCSTTFTRDLNTGATGADVMALQKFLNADAETRVAASGVGSTGMETQYYGPATAAAVSKFQVKYRAEILTPAGLVNPTGYFGPSTRAKANALCASTPTTPTTPGTPSTPSDDLDGGAGSISDADFISSLNNEEVGEDEEDVEVAGLEIEADDGSDIELTAVTLDFDYADSGADDELEDYAAEVSVWFDGEEVARVDADEFDDDNGFSRTVSLDRGAIIRAGETGELVVAVSGVSNLDGSNAGENWNVAFEGVRFRDAQDAVITDTSTGDITTGNDDATTDAGERQFSFETFATAADVELKISEVDEDINDPQVIEIHATNNTDNIEVLSFEIEVDGDSDVELKDLPINFDSVGVNLEDAVSAVSLWMDGDEVGTENMTSGAGTDETITFDDLDLNLEAGDTYEFIVTVDLQSVADGIAAGDTIAAQLSSTERDAIDAEDESGEDIATGDMTGTATAGPHGLFETGIRVSVGTITESATTQDSANNDTATFVINYSVEAFGGDVWVSDTATATTATTPVAGTSGVFYRVDHAGTATVAGLSPVVTFTNKSGVTDAGGNGIKINEGVTADFKLTVTRTNTSANGTAALFRMALEGIAWEDAAAGADEFTYTFDLDDFETDYVFIN